MASYSVPPHLFKLIFEINAVDELVQKFGQFEATGPEWEELEAAVDDAWPSSDTKLMRISQAVLDIVKSNADINFQHIEVWLRKKQLAGVVWISSTPNPDPDRFDMLHVGTPEKKAPRALHIIIRDAVLAMNEIIHQEGIASYNDNFKLLLETGVLVEKSRQG